MKNITFTSLEAIKQEQKDYEEYIEELRRVNCLRDQLMQGFIFTPKKAMLAMVLGNYRKVLLWMGAQIWPERQEEAIQTTGIIRRFRRAFKHRKKAA